MEKINDLNPLREPHSVNILLLHMVHYRIYILMDYFLHNFLLFHLMIEYTYLKYHLNKILGYLQKWSQYI